MAVLVDLKGVSRKETNAIYIKNASEIKNITTDTAVTAAGPNGAINIWLADNNNYRCEAMRFMVTIEEEIFSDIDKVEKWAKKWLRKIK